MIEYKYPQEKDILLHYAKVLNDEKAKTLVQNGCVSNSNEAEALSRFYWAMVDQAVSDKGQDVAPIESEGVEAWMEYIFHSINGYMVSNGYETQWDQE
ncbi:MAG: hypothetical protein K6L80_08160 [Agarilytica sp.]